MISFFHQRDGERSFFMKGYCVESGYMGFIDGEYCLFADESDYREAYYEIYE